MIMKAFILTYLPLVTNSEIYQVLIWSGLSSSFSKSIPIIPELRLKPHIMKISKNFDIKKEKISERNFSYESFRLLNFVRMYRFKTNKGLRLFLKWSSLFKSFDVKISESCQISDVKNSENFPLDSFRMFLKP